MDSVLYNKIVEGTYLSPPMSYRLSLLSFLRFVLKVQFSVSTSWATSLKFTCTHIHTDTCTYIHTQYIYTHALTHIHPYTTYMYRHTKPHIHICTYTHTRTHTLIHTLHTYTLIHT